MNKKYSKYKSGIPYIQTRVIGEEDIETVEEIIALISKNYTKKTPAAAISFLLEKFREDKISLNT